MTVYADPHRCPDCRGPIRPGAPACPRCGLPLAGETAARLFQTLSLADALLASLRTTAPGAASAPAGREPATAGPPAPEPAGPRASVAPSVPRILLGLGALCLLVAALVFLAVTWSALGVGGRTAMLVCLTAVTATVAGWLGRRGLRAAAESLSVVGYGLLTLDVVGADHAGWFGDLSTPGLSCLVGLTLVASGLAGALLSRELLPGRLLTAEAAAVLGLVAVVVGLPAGDWFGVSWSLVLATSFGAVLAAAGRGLRLRLLAGGAALVAVLTWAGLSFHGLDRVLDAGVDWRALVADGRAGPLLAAAAFAAALATMRSVALPARVAAASLAVLETVVCLLAPVHEDGATTQALVCAGVLLAASALTALLPHPWRLVTAATQVVAGVAATAWALLLCVVCLGRLGEVADDRWRGSVGDVLPPVRTGDLLPAPWLLPLLVLALVGTGWSVLRSLPVRPSSAPALAAAAPGVLAAVTVTSVALYPVPVWLPVALLVAVASGHVAWWLAQERAGTLAGAGAFAGAALLVAFHAEGLTAATLGSVVLLALVAHLRSRSGPVAAAGGGTTAVAVAALVWTGGALLDAPSPWFALLGVVLVGGLAVLAPYAPQHWWRSGVRTATVGTEVGFAVAALPLAVAGTLAAHPAHQASWVAGYLTAVGALVTVQSLLRADRRELGWAGGVLLALASWVRLWDLGVTAPEAYTLPSAAVLVAVGVLRLHRDPTVGTLRALAPGLGLALVPSLLWSLDDPTGLRPLLLGLACLGLVLLGARWGWGAPVAVGATVGALLVLRLAAPYVEDAVPRWVLIGGAGAVLLTLGATWERRLQEARQVMGYVRGLR